MSIVRKLAAVSAVALTATFAAACTGNVEENARPAQSSAALTPRATSADARALLDAFRTTIARRPEAARVAEREIFRQMTTTRPLGVVEGRWVVLLDMRKVFEQRGVKEHLLSGLGGDWERGGILPDHMESNFGAMVIPDQILRELGADLAGIDRWIAVGEGALAQSITDAFPWGKFFEEAGKIVAGAVIGLLLTEGYDDLTEKGDGPDDDYDGDGKINRLDADDDGDGVVDDKDKYPWDKDHSICDLCGGYGGTRPPPRVVTFTSPDSLGATQVILDAFVAGVDSQVPSQALSSTNLVVFPSLAR